MKPFAVAIILATVVAFGLTSADSAVQNPASQPAEAGTRTNIPYSDARPILETVRVDLLPAELRGGAPAGRETAWPAWVARRDAEIRARLERGDEDSIANLLLFGVSFTKLPRVTARYLTDVGGPSSASAAQVVVGRIEDLAAGIASPGTNERLQFARTLIERKGVNPTAPEGRNQVRLLLLEIMTRVARESDAQDRRLESAAPQGDPGVSYANPATVFRDRGLSSDTSIFPNFTIERGLEAIRSAGMLDKQRVRRVAIVGPGLDFIDKGEGYDFYPPQTIQPLGVIDSLLRLGLATGADLRVTTLDLSPRINLHLETAGRRARAGEAYVLQLPRDSDEPWSQGLVTYWGRFGDRIGQETRPLGPPPGTGNIQIRAVSVQPAAMTSIIPRDVNIVLQRLELPVDQRFDLIIATNTLVYYDVFEQLLALANIASMLRPGGLFLSNDLIAELPTTPMDLVGQTDVVFTEGINGSRLLWFRRR